MARPDNKIVLDQSLMLVPFKVPSFCAHESVVIGCGQLWITFRPLQPANGISGAVYLIQTLGVQSLRPESIMILRGGTVNQGH